MPDAPPCAAATGSDPLMNNVTKKDNVPADPVSVARNVTAANLVTGGFLESAPDILVAYLAVALRSDQYGRTANR